MIPISFTLLTLNRIVHLKMASTDLVRLGISVVCYYLINECRKLIFIVRVIKSRRMRWAGHVARMGEEKGCIGSWWGNRRERHHWGDLGVDGWIILGWISRRWDVGIWTGLGWPRVGTGGGRL